MSMNANDYNESKKLPDQEPLPNGVYPATVAWIINMGMHPQRPFKGKAKEPKNLFKIAYQINGHFCKDHDGNEDEKLPVFLNENFPMHGLKADNARSTHRYKAIDPTNEYEGNWPDLLDKGCFVQSEQNPTDDKVYVNVANVTPTVKALPHTPLVNPGIVFDFYHPTIETWERLPEYIQKKCKEALNYEGSALQKLLGEEGQSNEQEEDNTGGMV